MREDQDYQVSITELPGTNGAGLGRTFLVPRRHFLAGAGAVTGAVAFGGLLEKHAYGVARVATVAKEHLLAFDTGVTNAMYIVAHPDDSLIFQSPDLLQNVQSNLNVLTVHLTAGDDGKGEAYWSGRESGVEAAYAQMAGVANSWTASTLNVGSHALVLQTLTAAAQHLGGLHAFARREATRRVWEHRHTAIRASCSSGRRPKGR